MARHPRRTLAGLLATFALLALLAGCSASGSDDAATTASTTTEAPGDEVPSTTEADDEPASTTTEPSDDDDGDDGDDGGSSTREAYVEAVADAMRQVEDSDFPIDDEQAGCLAPKWVDAIGYETLIDAGVTPEVLGGSEDGDTDAEFEDVVDRAMAEELVDAFEACGIDLEEYFYEGLTGDGSATADQAECLRSRLPEGYIRELMVTSMDGGDDALDADPDLESQLTEAFMACLTEG